MTVKRLLIANRGEIAIRIARAASDAGMQTASIYSEDDHDALHSRKTDIAYPLDGKGVPSYLQIEHILDISAQAQCDAIHPGYGLLSENSRFATACQDRGVRFVGPEPQTLTLFGDKGAARGHAMRCGVPILPGTEGPTELEAARAFLAALGPDASIMVKAVAGGGGRGMRLVRHENDLEDAFRVCRSEALKSFGDDALYVEQFLPRARHIEVQTLGDGTGAVIHLFDRDCSLQRRHQKIVEIAPAPDLPDGLRSALAQAAVAMAKAAGLKSLATFEFLVDAEALANGTKPPDACFAFIEANPRLQVEHTITEEVTGVDLVRAQLLVAGGASLADLGLTQERIPNPRGTAIQVRVNTETMAPDGTVKPKGGTLTAFDPPSGPGIRIDTHGYAGYRINPAFDSLLAKVIAHSPEPGLAPAIARTYRALCEFRLEGVETNLGFLQTLLRHPDLSLNQIHTRFVEDHAADLTKAQTTGHQKLFFDTFATKTDNPSGHVATVETSPEAPDDTFTVAAPLQGTIVSIAVTPGQTIGIGQELLIMDAMKMEHVVHAAQSGIVRTVLVAAGDTRYEGDPLIFIEPADVGLMTDGPEETVDLDHIRPDLAESIERHQKGFDEMRPEAVARRRKTGQRTVRENIDDLCDPGTFVEYGALAIAAQRRRRSVDELIERTPGDGMVTGFGQINGAQFGPEHSRCLLMSYDYTVLAGTQGYQNHRKKDRMFELARDWRLPVVLFAEGGGGRPGDTDVPGGVAGLDCLAFHLFGTLSGLVPLVGIVSGRCFAGNAALLGCCDVVIGAPNANIGMGGPAMIEGGGLGTFRPEEVGPMDVQVPNGVVDIAVNDEAEAVAAAKQYLSYFQGPLNDWECADQRLLRSVIPENRLRVYDIRRVIHGLADTGSVLELRPHFGIGMITAFIRIEGQPFGLIANNPMHLAGAIDSPGADKAARFMQLCDAFDIPILSLCDTPGMMVGPEIEKTALVRHCSRLFVVGANVTVPLITIILRKSYGLGAQAMAAGSFHATVMTMAWPTGEFGGMGLEGAVRLGYRREMDAIEDAQERQDFFEKMVARSYEYGKALNTASHFEIDDVIDPADTRHVVINVLRSMPPPEKRQGKKRPNIDTW